MTIPSSSLRRGGRAGGSWAAAAAFAFLAVTFVAQGTLARNPGWTIAGLFCLVIALWQFPGFRALSARASGETTLRITPDRLTRIAGPAATPIRREWERSAASHLTVTGNNLYLHSQLAASPPVLSGLDPEELEWIAEQVRHKWKLNPEGPQR